MHGQGATPAAGFARGSAVTMLLLSLAGRWAAGEGTPQDAGALGEQGCRWEAAFWACPFPALPLWSRAVLGKHIPLEAQNPSMVRVGRDLCGSPSPTRC